MELVEAVHTCLAASPRASPPPHHEVQRSSPRTPLLETPMPDGFPPNPRASNPRQPLHVGPCGRRRPPPVAVPPPPTPPGPQLPRRRCHRIRGGIGTPRGVAPRRATLRCGRARCRSSSSGRVETRCHRPLARFVRVTTRRVARGLPCGEAAVDEGKKRRLGGVAAVGESSGGGRGPAVVGRPAAVGSGSGSGERQQSSAAAGTRQTTSHAAITAAAKVTLAEAVPARVEAGASGGERHRHCGGGGSWGG